ncbi:MAG: hypothetical protein JXB46_02370, partial [Candidatus Eisenbacteria bacterium]|nr:hypothetical protein [Candidatus Eisenbacteria bacterium]
YLRPSGSHRPVTRFLPPEEFDEIRDEGLRMGFRWVSAGPFVRSSYRAEEAAAALTEVRSQGRRGNRGGAAE